MYLMYVDESGDPGLVGSPTPYFALSGLVLHETEWRASLQTIQAFRQRMRAQYELPLRTEIHASHYINKPVLHIRRYDRLSIIRNHIDEIARVPAFSVTNVIVDKASKAPPYDVFTEAWKVLFQRFENTLMHGNFPGGHRGDYGIALTDNTDGRKLTNLMRKMNVYNPVPNNANFGPGYRNLPIVRIIEDPHPKNSESSYFIQAADTCAFALYQKFKPCTYIRRKGAANYFDRLRPVLNRWARPANPLGIVML